MMQSNPSPADQPARTAGPDVQRVRPFGAKAGLIMAGRWIIGFLVALALVAFAGGFFVDNYPARKWSDVVKRPIPPEGLIIQWRREGWGSTRFWRWGVSGVNEADVRAPRKVLIWGDSYVEAFQVDDEVKLPRQVTRELEQAGLGKIHAVGIGESSFSSADWFFGLPIYQKIFDPVCANVFIVTQLEDFYPDAPDAVARYVSSPALGFQLPEAPPSDSSRSLDFFYRWHLQALQKVRDQALGGGGLPELWQRLEFRLGPRRISARSTGLVSGARPTCDRPAYTANYVFLARSGHSLLPKRFHTFCVFSFLISFGSRMTAMYYAFHLPAPV